MATSIADRILTGSVALMLITAAVQFGGRLVKRPPAAPTPLLPGGVFSAMRGFDLPGVLTNPPCVAAFVVDPMCPACNSIAAQYAKAEGLHWIVAGTRDMIDQFTTTHSLPESRVIRLEDEEASRGLDVLRQHGVFGVPTQVALTPDYRVMDIRLVRSRPEPHAVAQEICTAGD